jgi:hypothetical protein
VGNDTTHARQWEGPDKRLWAQDVAVTVDVLRCRLDAREAALGPDMPPQDRAVIAGVRRLLDKAELATRHKDPRPTRLGNWWRGTLIEAAYQNVHAAEAEIVRLYDDAEVAAEIPEAVARVEASLHRDDPRRRAAHQLPDLAAPDQRVALLKAVEVGTAATDRQHTRVRSFRNVVLVTAALLLLVVAAVVLLAWSSPGSLPLCFTPEDDPRACPAGGSLPSERDAAVVALMGALGGVLAAAVNIRNLRGTSTPYDVPVALSLLKVPAGALTALAALFAIRGQFVPGLSALDSQEQILAYALVFGYAQQLLTRLIDRQAGTVLDSVVSKEATVERPELGDWPPRKPDGTDFRAAGTPSGGTPVPVQTTRDNAVDDLQTSEPDVLALLDSRPVPLVEGELGEGYAVLRDEHFGPEELHDDRDLLVGEESTGGGVDDTDQPLSTPDDGRDIGSRRLRS